MQKSSVAAEIESVSFPSQSHPFTEISTLYIPRMSLIGSPWSAEDPLHDQHLEVVRPD